MADNLAPKLTVEDSKVESLELNEAVIEAVDVDAFDDELVPGDNINFGSDTFPLMATYVDPDMQDPAADLVIGVNDTSTEYLPTPSIILSSVVKTRRVLAGGQVVYDIKFNVEDVGAGSYEVAYVKQ